MKALPFLLALLAVAPIAGARHGVTFNKEIAPILFANCVGCHRPGKGGPFPLTTYREVRKRAQLIARVTASRYMPPWLPEPGFGKFEHERRLSDEQIATIAQWVRGGAAEGRAADLPELPPPASEWQLGPPDLIVTASEAYQLAASGEDVYRNFVIPGLVDGERYLRACEFRPGTPSAVHHAFMLLDDSGGARRRDRRDPEPGFPGMDAGGAAAPDAMFMSWQPGSWPAEAPPGLAATLHKSTDLVLQLHLRPTGKPETVQPSVGLYFTQGPPTRAALMLLLRTVQLDIPASESDYAAESSYKLAADVDAVSVLPHLHYLGKEVHGWAELPDGSRQELVYIRKWNFDWQGAYRFAEPVFLPKGTVLRMRYTYDNSAANPRNPNQPPQRVTYGTQSSDEMGEFWLQVLTRHPSEREALWRDYVANRGIPDDIGRLETMLRKSPDDAALRTDLGAAFTAAGKIPAAIQALEQAVVGDPSLARPHYILGQIYWRQQNGSKARLELERAAALDPEDFNTQNNLGWLLLAAGDRDRAIQHLEKAIEIKPGDPRALDNLTKARAIPPRN